jgi:hypothetical protein
MPMPKGAGVRSRSFREPDGGRPGSKEIPHNTSASTIESLSEGRLTVVRDPTPRNLNHASLFQTSP